MREHTNTAFSIEQSDQGLVKISLQGSLNMRSVSTLCEPLLQLQKQHHPDQFIINANALTFCDAAGHALFEILENAQKKLNKQFKIENIPENIKLFSNFIDQQSAQTIPQKPTQKGFVVSVGKYIIDLLGYLREDIIFLGMLIVQSIQFFTKRKGIRWQDLWISLEEVGPNALPIIILIGFLIGLISTFQAARPMGNFGAQIYIVNLVGLGLVREMGPLMTAVLLAGRTASAFAAEIGTMKINEEISALKTMGLSPIKFLTLPRILATAIMTPILNVFLILFGLIGSAIVMNSLGYNAHIFIDQLNSALKLRDFITGSIKGFAFGIVIAATGCLHGLKTKFGPSAVGHATTKAVVSSLILIVVVDGIFACIYYALGV